MERKRKESNKLNKSRFIIIGSLLVLFGIGLISFDVLSDISMDNLEDKAITEFYEQKEIIQEDEQDINETKNDENKSKESSKIEYIGVLSIPKINLKRGLVDPNSSLNDIQYNVKFLNESSMPDELYGNVILAAHSGNARISYFKNLDKLDVNDEIIIDYKNNNYTYSVVNKYEIEKTGKTNIIRNRTENTLTLITCKHNTNKQIVVICELVK